ncbi:cadherin-related family member 4 [Canis lupus familiaris]|uniref:cadherin-related family member 4 n=1 Tax=Canis lupus dingo TaxID=286419 RepID=UPI0015F13FC2|nr:cadherin-related family member 4 [Canis lupus dingo]XP_038282557.1 cadherin-related family member 4 [Canis lupus familiaris]XP_038311258.1 cadherin-related family member 4 [Canis lupus familiaris]XP_038421285.1 cadherin-related family member 4 [Canis lupus familiaris]
MPVPERPPGLPVPLRTPAGPAPTGPSGPASGARPSAWFRGCSLSAAPAAAAPTSGSRAPPLNRGPSRRGPVKARIPPPPPATPTCGQSAPKQVHCLPWFINVSESQGPGTILKSFPFNCTLHMPILELIHVKPPTTFFNPPSLTRWHGIYMGMVTLSSSARLDALAVNHYELQLRFTCGNYVMEGLLFVDVQRDPGYSSCAGRFASPAGEIIQVRETVTPGTQLYTLLLPGVELQRAQISIISAQDPPYFPGPFSINGQGWLLAPSQGLKGQGQKVFQLQILVTFGQNRSCHGTLKVKVLPAPSSQISFLQQAPNITIREDLAPGSEVVQVRARGFDVRYEILSPVPCPLFSIGRADGLVRTAAPLESALARGAGVAVTRLRVKAYERLRPRASVELDLTVNVRSVNRWPPRCLPAMLVTEIRETTLVGTVLNTFTCTDPDSSGSTLDYELRFYSPPGLASLCLRDRALEVNATLDCDAPGACFQHAASILVLNGDQPLTEVPVLVMVTPVNEFSPACVPHTFRIREDAGPYTLLGSVVGMDKDYPHNSIEYFISGGPSTFSVDRLSGEIHLLGSLDYELQKSYRLTVLVTDHSQDQDPTQRRSGSCTITIEVEDVNDHSPECQPPFQELTIYTPLGRSVEVTKVSCWVPQEPQRLTFSYSIVGGTSQSRFSLQGAILVYNDIMLGPPWPEQSHSYELLIRVADSGPSIPHLSTTATIIVHVVPWNASTASTRIHRVTVPSMMTPLLVTDTEVFWQPEPWFVVVLTVTSALFLLALGWLFSRLFQGLAQMLQTPNKPAHELLLNSIQGTEESIEGFIEAPRMEMPQAPSSVMSLEHFDGRAQDPRTGRDYLFNTLTGARRWL